MTEPAAGGGWRPGVRSETAAAFTETELRHALEPHLEPEQARDEAATIAATLEDAPMTGATLNDDVLAMLYVSSPELADRVTVYRERIMEQQRHAWLRRELHDAAARGHTTDDVAGDTAARWDARRADEEAAWLELVARVRAAVELHALEREGVRGGFVQLKGREDADG